MNTKSNAKKSKTTKKPAIHQHGTRGSQLNGDFTALQTAMMYLAGYMVGKGAINRATALDYVTIEESHTIGNSNYPVLPHMGYHTYAGFYQDAGPALCTVLDCCVESGILTSYGKDEEGLPTHYSLRTR